MKVAALVGSILLLLASSALSHSDQDFSSIRQASYLLKMGDGGTCSAVLVAPKTLLTAAHCVLDGDSTVAIRKDMTINSLPVVVLKADKERDLALLFADIPGVGVPVAEKDVPVDTPLVIVGYPVTNLTGEDQYLTEGRRMGNHRERPTFMNMTVPINFGNSGGGVFAEINGQWYVVGIMSGVYVIDYYMQPVVTFYMSIAANAQSIREFLQ